MKAVFACIIFLAGFYSYAQEKVSFYTSDSLKVTADLYLNDYQLPFIILLHQAESSRGEYISIAPKLLNFGYNCLAIDLRSGNKINYVVNETAERAKKQHKPSKFLDAETDIQAAIEYINKYNRKPIILFGSSYSASLALLMAEKSDNVKAVIAFSPGEYFRPELDVKPHLAKLKMPIFVASSEIEYKYVVDLLMEIPDSTKVVFKPSEGRGVHGAKALWEESQGSKECWFQLTYFFGKLKNS